MAELGFRIGVTCPGCGGALELQKDFHVLTCSHCNSILRIEMPESTPAFLVRPKKTRTELRFALDRYCKEKALPLPGHSFQNKEIYYPYWYISAIGAKKRVELEERLVDSEEFGSGVDDFQIDKTERTSFRLAPYKVSLPAGFDDSAIPYSLGVRTDHLLLEPFSPEKLADSFEACPVAVDWNAALLRLDKLASQAFRAWTEIEEKNSTTLFHLRGEIIYVPYVMAEQWIDGTRFRFVVDAVTGKVLSGGSAADDSAAVTTAEPKSIPFGSLTVVPHRCRNCGEEFSPSESVVYHCHNCGRVSFLEKDPHLSMSVSVIQTSDKSAVWLPFWSVSLTAENKTRTAVVPAFNCRNPESAFRLLQRMSHALAKMPSGGKLEKTDMTPVAVSLHESVALAEIAAYRAQQEREVRAVKQVSYELQSAQLCLVPFVEEQYFLMDAALHAVSIEKAALGQPSTSLARLK